MITTTSSVLLSGAPALSVALKGDPKGEMGIELPKLLEIGRSVLIWWWLALEMWIVCMYEVHGLIAIITGATGITGLRLWLP